jgi:eukaryotic-like serine/threonine-protein kinase
MPTERWHRLEQIFTEASEHPAGARLDFLERACASDTDMREEIQLLLTAAEQSGDFLGAPALDVFARQIGREGWTVRPGDRIGSYTIAGRLGVGATGEVWRARDERLARDVAIKLLLPHPSNLERVRAGEQEARTAGTLNHPNVVTVYDVGEYGGAPFLVTEYLDGESLRARLGAGALSLDAALDVALQVARGLGAAHQRGIVHRDLKPENIFLARDGRVKILDFGLALLLDGAPTAQTAQISAVTARSLVAGTVGYMAPEQVRGDHVDQRTDIFALGAVLYEMLAAQPPFKGSTALERLNASLTIEPRDLSEATPGISPAIVHIVGRCLAKSPSDRFATVADLAAALEEETRAVTSGPKWTLRAFARSPVARVAAVVMVIAAALGTWQWRVAVARARWARTIAAPEIQRLSLRGDYVEAFLLARQALDLVPNDPQLRQLWLNASAVATMTTEPLGADVAFASYRSPTSWFSLGRTPLKSVRVPRTIIRLRISKDGFQPIEGSGAPGAFNRYRLDPVDSVPPGMVRVVRGRDPDRFGAVGEIGDFWIDRLEVSNREFKMFVDRGGYRNRNYWREPFIEGGRSISWQDAVDRFHDGSGRPGPATWMSGTYPTGQAELPVGGVSWYEAAAYAVFAGKSLPTIYHWYRAADLGRFADILIVSNFNGTGPVPVGSFAGLGPFGTLDMAGNVKEWCSTGREHERFLLGGAWNEHPYTFSEPETMNPFDRAPVDGFRLAKYIEPLRTEVTAPVHDLTVGRDARTLTPVSDEIFAVFRRQFAYDRGPLNAVVEGTEETDSWVKHVVAFDTAYGGERMHAYLFLPKTGSPPYQTVIFFPAPDAFQLRSSRDMSLSAMDFIVGSGRAFLYPIYKGTYERVTRGENGPNDERDLRVAWSRDLGRAIDYLETRSDIDRSRLAFYGISDGADTGVILTALEPRLKTSVLQATGIGDGAVPEIDLVNYAPRIRIPTLMLNGRYDFGSPVETQQDPLFALLGSPPEQKLHRVFESGHALTIEGVRGEILPWLDRYLGPVHAVR